MTDTEWTAAWFDNHRSGCGDFGLLESQLGSEGH